MEQDLPFTLVGKMGLRCAFDQFGQIGEVPWGSSSTWSCT
jgi:hypothetical protein